MEASFFVLGLGCLMLLLGLIHFGIRSWVPWLGAFHFGVEFLASVVAAACPMDPPGGPRTLAGQIHDINFYVGIGSFSLAVLLLTDGSWIDIRWRANGGMMIILASLYVVGVILQVLTEQPGMPYGLANRFVFATFIAWPLVGAILLRPMMRNSYTGP